jgi:hypothetical protein
VGDRSFKTAVLNFLAKDAVGAGAW